MKEQTLTAEVLKITNESPYGWLHLDSVEAEKISKLLDDSINAKVLEALEIVQGQIKNLPMSDMARHLFSEVIIEIGRELSKQK